MEPTCQLHDAGTLCVVHGIAGPHIACDWDFILRESGRRVWTTLQYHDRLSWQARQNRGSALRGNSVPHNLDDVEIGQVAIVRPKSEATMVSHLLCELALKSESDRLLIQQWRIAPRLFIHSCPASWIL